MRIQNNFHSSFPLCIIQRQIMIFSAFVFLLNLCGSACYTCRAIGHNFPFVSANHCSKSVVVAALSFEAIVKVLTGASLPLNCNRFPLMLILNYRHKDYLVEVEDPDAVLDMLAKLGQSILRAQHEGSK